MVSDKVVIAGIVSTGLAAGGLFGVILTHNAQGAGPAQPATTPTKSNTGTEAITPPQTITLLPPSSTATFDLDTPTPTPTTVEPLPEPQRGKDPTTTDPAGAADTTGKGSQTSGNNGRPGKTPGVGRQRTRPSSPHPSKPVTTHTINAGPGTTATVGSTPPNTPNTPDEWVSQLQKWWTWETSSWWQTPAPTEPAPTPTRTGKAAHSPNTKKTWAEWFARDALPTGNSQDHHQPR